MTSKVPRMTMTISLADLPEVVAALRREMAEILRQQAGAEVSGYVAARLCEVAAAFEAGQRTVSDGE